MVPFCGILAENLVNFKYIETLLHDITCTKNPDVFNMIVYFDVYSSLVKSYEFSSGYYGSNNAEKTRIDVISGAVDDIIFLMERLFYNETVEAAKENLKKEMVSWRLEEFLGIMEETLKENHNGDKFFVGDQASLQSCH